MGIESITEVVESLVPECKLDNLRMLVPKKEGGNKKSVHAICDVSCYIHAKAYAVQQRRIREVTPVSMTSVEWTSKEISDVVEYVISDIFGFQRWLSGIIGTNIPLTVVSDGAHTDKKMRCSPHECRLDGLNSIRTVLRGKKLFDPVSVISALFMHHGEDGWLEVAQSIVNKYCKKIVVDLFEKNKEHMTAVEYNALLVNMFTKYMPSTALLADYIGARCSTHSWEFIAAEGEADKDVALKAWSVLAENKIPIIYAKDGDYFVIGAGMYISNYVAYTNKRGKSEGLVIYNLERLWKDIIQKYPDNLSIDMAVNSVVTHFANLSNDYTLGVRGVGPKSVIARIANADVHNAIPDEWVEEWGPQIAKRIERMKLVFPPTSQ